MSGIIVWLGPTEPGKSHDKTICLGLKFPKQTTLLCDLAYLGFRAENANVLLPHKKPKGGQLTADQKAENRELARMRVVVEHAIGRLKRFQILVRRFRLKRREFADLAIRTVASICNFQIDFFNSV